VSWSHQKARWGYHELCVWKELGQWRYVIKWHTETAITKVGEGSERYEDVYEAREAALLHLANILPKPQSKRLLIEQANLAWEPW
jgi:hypothetical protein